jgi:hypothetical protein
MLDAGTEQKEIKKRFKKIPESTIRYEIRRQLASIKREDFKMIEK